MLVTDTFVLINYPKTGSTFARTVLKDIYNKRLRERSFLRKFSDSFGLTKPSQLEELMLPNIKVKHVKRPRDQHGCYCQIPKEFRDRKIATIIRNPYTRFLSAYTYEWWKKYPPLPESMLYEKFPHFPDLTIDDYVELVKLATIHGRLDGKCSVNIGDQSVQFIQMFFKQSDQVLSNLSDNYLTGEQPFSDIADIQFLQQEDLNNQLADFLADNGFSAEEVNLARNKEKVNVTEPNKDRTKIWTDKSLRYIEESEKLIFRIYERAGIFYKKPEIKS